MLTAGQETQYLVLVKYKLYGGSNPISLSEYNRGNPGLVVAGSNRNATGTSSQTVPLWDNGDYSCHRHTSFTRQSQGNSGFSAAVQMQLAMDARGFSTSACPHARPHFLVQ